MVIVLCAVAYAVTPSCSFGQDEALDGQQDRFDLTELQTPASPAFTILGIEHNSIERPSTPRALAVSLLSATQSGTVIPENYALEAAPYWLKSNPTLEYAEYIDPDPAQAAAQTLTLSIATSRTAAGTDSLATNIGVGFRMLPLIGEPTAELKGFIEQHTQLEEARLDLRIEMRTAASREDSIRVDRLLALNRDSLKMLNKSIQEADHTRVGLRVEVTGALNVGFPSNTFEQGTMDRWGLWTTLGYRLERPDFDFLALLRMIRNTSDPDVTSGAAVEQSLVDVGTRVLWTNDRLVLSTEFVNRFVFDVADTDQMGGTSRGTITYENSYRLTGSAQFEVTDDTFLVATFGRDYEREDVQLGTLVAALGLTVQFGSRPSVAY